MVWYGNNLCPTFSRATFEFLALAADSNDSCVGSLKHKAVGRQANVGLATETKKKTSEKLMLGLGLTDLA